MWRIASAYVATPERMAMSNERIENAALSVSAALLVLAMAGLGFALWALAQPSSLSFDNATLSQAVSLEHRAP